MRLLVRYKSKREMRIAVAASPVMAADGHACEGSSGGWLMPEMSWGQALGGCGMLHSALPVQLDDKLLHVLGPANRGTAR